ncbi:hypothetical protein MTR_1g016235 [Medicago truncatula]|uniref:Uncharacterized protein n=1 Tax=Medicago truncatula TaxID=3880 RepID=A0A072VD49_MEDTR|nr:hypothetical protein MTR_1g016235 [Medicago truncatula]
MAGNGYSSPNHKKRVHGSSFCKQQCYHGSPQLFNICAGIASDFTKPQIHCPFALGRRPPHPARPSNQEAVMSNETEPEPPLGYT